MLMPLSISAQVILNNNPGSLKWQAINTEDFEVIFPEGFDEEGLRVANTLEYLYDPVSESMSTKPRKISVILQNQNSISNGFVTLAPRRSEFFTTSPQDPDLLGSNDWLDLLSVHELRHVVQFDKSRKGFTKFVSTIWGQEAQSGMAFLSVPIWFWEGDAVVMESVLTPSGRGRIPNFDLVMRTRNLEKGAFNYHKQYLGSFKDFVPSHYVIGYHMTSYLRQENGENVWDQITDDAFKKSIIPFTFSNSIKKYTGKYVVNTYNDMSEDITSKWREQQSKVIISDFDNLLDRKNDRFTNYIYPQELNNGSILVLKAGISDISTFVEINKDLNQKKIFIPGIYNDPGFLTVGNDVIAWTEFEFHPRWRQKNYSVIKTYDIKTKSQKTITSKSRYSGAAISPDGKKIIAVNNGENGEITLEVLAAVNGYVLQKIENPDNSFYSQPRWDELSKKVVAVKHGKKGKAIVKIDPDNGEEVLLLDYTYDNIGHPVLNQNFLFYNSPYSGIDNIYAKDLETGKSYQVTSAKYAAYNPSISRDGSIIYYNDFTNNGHDIASIENNSSNWKPIEGVDQDPTNYFEPAIEQEKRGNILDSIPDTQYNVNRYPKSKKLFNIHSWGPYVSFGAAEVRLGVIVNDILSQTNGYLGYNYDVGQGAGKWTFEYSYQNLFTIIDFEASVGNRKAEISILDTARTVVGGDTIRQVRNVKYDWKESGFATGLRIPLILTHSKFRQSFSVQNYFAFNNVYDFNTTYPSDDRWFLDFGRQGQGILLSNIFGFNYAALLKQAKRDINPKWGFSTNFTWTSTPYGGDYEGGQRAISGRLYLPGFFKHNSINFYAAYQKQDITLEDDNYWFGNRVLFPRGYSAETWEDFYTIRSMYELTLWNADLALGPILNIQRIRTELFYDYGYGQFDVQNPETGLTASGSRAYNSLGAELLFDFNAFRIRALLSAGVRAVYDPNNNTGKFEIVIGNLQI